MLFREETKMNGQTFASLTLSFFGLLIEAWVSLVFLNLILSWTATARPIKPNKINGISVFVYLKKNAPYYSEFSIR